MYEDYFHFSQSPFSIAPDPNFLYLSDGHSEALAHLMYGFSHGGFVLITGEVGTGKTTLLHALLAQLDADTASAFIFNPRLDVLDFLRLVLEEYGIEETCRTKAKRESKTSCGEKLSSRTRRSTIRYW